MDHPTGCTCERCFGQMLRAGELRTQAAILCRSLAPDALEEALAYLRDLADRERALEPAAS